MESKRINEFVVVIVSFLLILILVFGFRTILLKKDSKEINISNVAINISNESEFEKINTTSIDIASAKKMFNLKDEEFAGIVGRKSMLNSYACMFILIKSTSQHVDDVEKKVIEYGKKYEEEWSTSENKEQYEIVKKRVIGRKDNIIYMIVSADAEKLVEHIK